MKEPDLVRCVCPCGWEITLDRAALKAHPYEHSKQMPCGACDTVRTVAEWLALMRKPEETNE